MSLDAPRLIIDGNSIAWRAFHIGSSSTGQGFQFKGKDTGAAFIFLKMLRTALDSTRARSVVIAWDAGVSKFRRKVFPEYKLRRKVSSATPEALKVREEFLDQVEWVKRDMLPLMGIHQCWVEGWEADDVVARLRLSQNLKPQILFSGDRDMWQLLGSNTSILYPDRGLITLYNFIDHSSFKTPKEWLFFRIMTGDSSDGIPGIGGVGEKRARELVEAVRIDQCGGFGDAFRISALALYDQAWYEKRRELFNRNCILMNLSFASNLLKAELTTDKVKAVRVKAAPNMAKLLNQLQEAGMRTLVSSFFEWSEPFRRLER